MANKETIENRRKDLKNFLLDSKEQSVTKKHIDSFYDKKYPGTSPSTIGRDLKEINAKCDKRNNNKYYLEDIKKIHSIKSKICKLLKKCIIYKPLKLSSSVDILDNDFNPTLNYYCITIKPKSSNHEEYFLENLYARLKKLPQLYSNYDNFNFIDIKEYNSSIIITFDNKNSLKKYYTHLNNLKSFNDTSQK